MEITKARIYKSFMEHGTSEAEAKMAAMLASRFNDLYQTVGKEEIKNLYFFLRKSIFKNLASEIRSKGEFNNADQIFAACCVDLGIFSLEDKERPAEAQATTLDIDLNELLGFDLSKAVFANTVNKVCKMLYGEERVLASKHNLNITTVTWEDSDRNYNSCFGNNISDCTLRVDIGSSAKELPVIRTNNFKDATADIDPENFNVNVGNATGSDLKQITLKDVLEKPWELMHDPELWPLKDENGDCVGLYAAGVDNKVLVSSQACFMPVSQRNGEAVYNPTIYNYQSWYDKENGPQPHVLTIVVTRNGASIDICGRDNSTWKGRGQPLWFNDNGKRAPLVAKRPTTRETFEMRLNKENGLTAQNNSDQHNRVLIVQVPLTPALKKNTFSYDIFGNGSGVFGNLRTKSISRGISDVQDAVIHVGETDGDYDEFMGTGWKRDVSNPVRVTVQLVKATSNGVVTEEQMEQIANELKEVYSGASRIGSLVVAE